MYPGSRPDTSSKPNPGQSKVYAEATASGTIGPEGTSGGVCVKAEIVPWQKPVERGKTGGGGKWRLRYSQNDKLGYRGREKRVRRAKGKLDRPCRPKTAWLTCASRCRSWGAMEILEGSMALSGLGLEGFLGHEIVRP